jgi:hypothetical protein
MTHQFREDGRHFNGGKEFFGYGYTAIGEPRLSMIRRWYRSGARRGQSEDRFFVDGAHVPTYEAAQEALKAAPTFTAAEIEALRRIGDEPADRRQEIDHETLHYLRHKGAIAWGPPGRCARTDVGRAALAAVSGGAG